MEAEACKGEGDGEMTTTTIHTEYLNSGWNDSILLAIEVDRLIAEQAKRGWKFRDIKISSSGNHSLLLFEKGAKL